MRSHLPLLLLALLTTPTLLLAQTPAPGPADAAGLLQEAGTRNNLDVEGLKPWHLKASFQLYDNTGNPTETGTVEEFRAGRLRKTIWSLPSFSATYVTNQDGHFHSGTTGTLPDFLADGLRTIIHPVPKSETPDKAKLQLVRKTVGGLPLACITIDKPVNTEYLLDSVTASMSHGAPGSICFDDETAKFRMSANALGTLTIAGKLGIFQGRSVPLDLTISSNKVRRLSLQVNTLETLPEPVDAAFVPPADAVRQNTVAAHTNPPTGGELLHSYNAPVPNSVRYSHPQGGVIFLDVVIAKDGHVKSTRVISQPKDGGVLAYYAQESVKQWVYSPMLLDGKPMEYTRRVSYAFRF